MTYRVYICDISSKILRYYYICPNLLEYISGRLGYCRHDFHVVEQGTVYEARCEVRYTMK